MSEASSVKNKKIPYNISLPLLLAGEGWVRVDIISGAVPLTSFLSPRGEES